MRILVTLSLQTLLLFLSPLPLPLITTTTTTTITTATAASISAKKAADLIQQTCKLTPFYDLCDKYLRSDPEGSSADLPGLGRIMANTVLSNANETLNHIQDLINHAPDPETEAPLAYCAELYIPVVKYNLPQAIDAMSKGSYGFAVYNIADAEKEAQQCEKKVAGTELDSELSELNKLVVNLADVSLAIIKILQKG